MAVISFDECLKKRMLVRVAPSRRLAEKEMSVAKEDLRKARHTFEADMDYKWSTVKAYYAMFHAARALLYAIGLRERSHDCIAEALRRMSKEGKIQSYFVDDFVAAMSSRESADYRNTYSKDQAQHMLEAAGEFVAKMEGALGGADKNVGHK